MDTDAVAAVPVGGAMTATGFGLAVLLALAGCGADDGGSSPPASGGPAAAMPAATDGDGMGPEGPPGSEPGAVQVPGAAPPSAGASGAEDPPPDDPAGDPPGGTGSPGDGNAMGGMQDGPAGDDMDGAQAPAAGEPGSTDGMDGADDQPGGSRPPSTGFTFEVTTENPMVEPYFNVYRPADMEAAMEATGGKLPVVAWASGGCFRADFAWAAVLERWAAGGYVVLGLTPGPDASVPGTTSAVEHGELLDWAEGQTDYPDMLDLDRMVAAGNSCGGVTALELTSMDERVAAVFVLSGSSAIGAANTAVMAGVKVPLGFVVGSATEDIAAGPAQMDYDLLGDGIPGMLVNRTTGDHVTVSTGEAVLPEVAEISLNWMDLALYGTPEAAMALESDNVCANCTAGDWVLKAKHWDSLLK